VVDPGPNLVRKTGLRLSFETLVFRLLRDHIRYMSSVTLVAETSQRARRSRAANSSSSLAAEACPVAMLFHLRHMDSGEPDVVGQLSALFDRAQHRDDAPRAQVVEVPPWRSRGRECRDRAVVGLLRVVL
jgi:hypothetical protein